ncbi:TonB-dependent receptor [Tenacibaculum agarivorans]|uniref:TonB-dependent receptor n=1 Tax=Tenacibaculum agarivorans TaxID=1908389 RepID=UPI00094BA8E1|nr:TonB-dependent receptor [Tenacibaculum agarivorans]
MKKNLLIALVCFCQLVVAQSKGTVTGTVTDKELNGEPLPFANVFIKGTSIGGNTDLDGKYTIAVPEGSHTLVFSFVGYQTIEKPITVVAGQTLTVNQEVGASGGEKLDEVQITGTVNKEKESALLLEQKKAVSIKTTIGSQELSRKGVSNVEQAVTKTTGVTKVASRGIFVRGLDERYNYLTVNGLPVSPSNWENKIPSLSQFSSSILRSVDVNKVFYPNLYGDFAGATMNVNTKDRPRKSYSKISISAGVNFQSLSNDFLTDKENGSLNYLGFGGKDDRRGPQEIRNSNFASPDLYTASGTKAINDFSSDWNTEQVDAPFSIGFGVENAGVLKNNDGEKTAYYVGLNYSNSYNSKIGSNELRNPQGSLIRNVNTSNSFDFSTTNNLLLGIFNKTEKTDLNFNYIFLKTTSNEVNDNFGRYTEVAANLLGRDSNFKQSYLSQFQFLGKTKFNENNIINYSATYGDSNYSQPDNNILSLEEIGTNDYIFSANSGKMFKYFLDSENYNVAGDVSYDYLFDANNSEEDKKNKLTIGANANKEELDVFNRFIGVNLINVGSISVNPDNIDASLVNAFNNNTAEYREIADTRFTNIDTEILAGYVSYNHNFNDKFSAQFGARFENFVRTVSGQNTSFDFNKFFVLPSFNLKYIMNDNMNLRLAGSKTYTKPKNIEIVDITRENSVGDLIKGNPNLLNSDNYSLDLKWEYFPSRNSLFSVNLFGKYIENPIERLVQDGGSFIQTVFSNTDEATLYGAEVELKTSLGYLTGNENLEGLTFGANVTLMQSEVNISDQVQSDLNLTNATRRLQGASDFLINADVSYKFNISESTESQFTVLFDTFSERISAVGSGASTIKYDDEFEKPFKNLSLTWKNDINKKIGITVKVNNLLNDTYSRQLESTLGGVVGVRDYTIGTSASLSLSYKF